MPVSVSLIRKISEVEPPLREVLLAILEEIEKQRAQFEQQVTKTEFNELKEIVRDLAEAQKRTEERMASLEQRMEELAEAQKKTEQELKKLVSEHRKTREQLGGLAHTVGYVLEDRAYKGLPALLKRDFQVELIEPLRRDYLEIGPNRYLEINIFGKAKTDGQDIWIVGEAKTQLKKRDVDAFIKNLAKIKEHLGDRLLPIVVTYQTPPPIRKYAKEKGLKVYFSYEFPY